MEIFIKLFWEKKYKETKACKDKDAEPGSQIQRSQLESRYFFGPLDI